MKILKFTLFLVFCVNLHANNDFVDAGKHFKLDPRILWAIAYKESRHNPNIVSKPNTNGTYDIGIMQINSSHLAWLERDFNITKNDLFNPRINIYIAAMILRKCFNKHGDNTNAGISCYNGRIANNPYANDVLMIFAKNQKAYKHKKLQKQIREAILGERNAPLIRVMNQK